MHRAIATIALTLAMLFPSRASPAAELGPQGIVRQFCQADGNGQRVAIAGWAALAPLLKALYEPAWDTIVLITGYTVRPTQPAGEDTLAVEVRYTVVGQLTPLGLNPEPHVESVTYRVQLDELGSWHILAPLPPPHLFASRVDIDAMRRSLSNGSVNFIANSVFVWQMFQSAGWNVPFESTTDLLSGATYQAVDTPKPGDLVVYLRDGAPYHVGLLEAENQVVSSTLNAGIARTAVEAFPGEVRYLRLRGTATVPAVVSPEPPPADIPAIQPAPGTPTARPLPRPTPKPSAATTKKKAPPPSKRRQTKPPAHKRAKSKQQGVRQHPHPTPASPTPASVLPDAPAASP